jgi:hypothetical protein
MAKGRHSRERGNPGGGLSRQRAWIPARARMRSLGRNDEVLVKHLRNQQK